jgi:hypothetical protein
MINTLVSGFIVSISVAVIVWACADGDNHEDLPVVKQDAEAHTLSWDPDFQYCDSVYIATFHGTACCVSGPMVAKPGDIFRYHYQINHSDVRVTWQILDGDISIIAGQNTQTVTVQFGEHFTTGIVFADGNGIPKSVQTRQRCTDRVIVGSH